MRRYLLLFVPLLFAACGGSSKTSTETKTTPAKAPEPVTGRYALNQMSFAARSWATDIQVLSLSDPPLEAYPTKEGKATVWQATFISPSQQKSRTYNYSVVDIEPSIHEGVQAGLPEAWGGPSGQDTPFIFQAIHKDSDDAYKVALKHSEEYRKKNPDLPIIYRLEQVRDYQAPVWRVIWGRSLGTSGFSVFVDANTGEYLKTER